MAALKTPYRDFLQPLSKDEFAALKADVKLRGVLQPIIRDEEGNILDGHHRYRIDPNAPTVTISGLSAAEKEAYVVSSNNRRRNLSPEQKAENRKRSIEIAGKLKAEDAKRWTQERIAVALGVPRETIRNWLESSNGHSAKARLDARVVLPKQQRQELVASVLAGQPQQQVAADYGLSKQRVSQLVQAAAQKAKIEQAFAAAKKSKPADQVQVLLADPPWQYDFAETVTRKVENQYPTATPAEIREHIRADWVPKLAADGVCFLWATAPKIREALEVLAAWGYEYKTHAVWDKEKIGMGYWFRGQHELLLVGTRGKFSPPEQSVRVSSVFREKRTNRHSQKPECVYAAIEAMYPAEIKFEMYSRAKRPGWLSGGFEA